MIVAFVVVLELEESPFLVGIAVVLVQASVGVVSLDLGDSCSPFGTMKCLVLDFVFVVLVLLKLS